MDELQRKMNEVLEKLSNDMMDIIRKADETGEGLDLTDFNKSLGQAYKDTNQHFIDFRERSRSKKRGIFG